LKEEYFKQQEAKEKKRELREIDKQKAKEREYIKENEKLYLASISKIYEKMRIISI
jgi:hypothetical protein